MMRGAWAAVRVGLLDLRGDVRRFGLLIACLAVGTALIAGVGSVGGSVVGRAVVPVQYCLELPGNTCRRSRIETVDGVPVRNDAGAVPLESAVKLDSDVEGRLLQGQ